MMTDKSIIEIITAIVVGILALPLLVFTHGWLERCYVAYAMRYCRKHGYVVSRCRVGPLFDEDGIKTEYSLVVIDCLDQNQRHMLLQLKVWAFGVSQVLSADDFPTEHSGEEPKVVLKRIPSTKPHRPRNAREVMYAAFGCLLVPGGILLLIALLKYLHKVR